VPSERAGEWGSDGGGNDSSGGTERGDCAAALPPRRAEAGKAGLADAGRRRPTQSPQAEGRGAQRGLLAGRRPARTVRGVVRNVPTGRFVITRDGDAVSRTTSLRATLDSSGSGLSRYSHSLQQSGDTPKAPVRYAPAARCRSRERSSLVMTKDAKGVFRTTLLGLPTVGLRCFRRPENRGAVLMGCGRRQSRLPNVGVRVAWVAGSAGNRIAWRRSRHARPLSVPPDMLDPATRIRTLHGERSQGVCSPGNVCSDNEGTWRSVTTAGSRSRGRRRT
jgi:hypothetical protein